MTWTSVTVLKGLVARRTTVLLDLDHTLAFDCDRFDAPEDFAATYEEMGGSALSPGDVSASIVATCDRLRTIGRDPSRYESFPRIEVVLATHEATRDLPRAEHERLAAVIGLHEVGTIPAAHADGVRKLSSQFRLGLVSNRTIFDIAMSEMNIGPDAAVYVGNSVRRDVIGGENAGIPVVWVNAIGEPVPERSPAGLVESFPSFVEALG